MHSIATKVVQLQQKPGGIPLEILIAIKSGDGEDLEKLLMKKSDSYDRNLYPVGHEDLKYQFSDLLKTDEDQLTSLQLACSIGNPEMSLSCVEILCESFQVAAPDFDDETNTDKSYKFINYALPGKPSALHLAIENRATKVISYLLDRNANLAAKSVDGTDALTLICQKVPDALKEVYDNAIQLKEDYKGFRLNYGPLIGVRRALPGAERDGLGVIDTKGEGGNNYLMLPEEESESFDSDRTKRPETEYLSYILKSENWGPRLLLHPLVKHFLERKWKKLQWFFWIAFLVESLWLLLYAVAFIQLNLYVEALKNETVAEVGFEPATEEELNQRLCHIHILWTALFFITIVAAGKEFYSACVLRRAYCTFENLAQISFILMYCIQFALLMAGDPEQVAVISAVGIALSTTLMIFQLGKTPHFGQQVAALKKVIYSCTPHLPIFFVWFLGFCLIFWALFYKSNESSVIVLLAIVAAMGTGEINAKDHLEDNLKRSLELQDIISVFCLLIFIITIVTLYFNLLIGYAVTDIKELKPKAEAIHLSYLLSTMYTVESFLLSKFGRVFVRVKNGLDKICGKSASSASSYLDSIYVIPPSKFKKSAIEEKGYEEIPPKILNSFKEIAYENLKKDKEKKVRSEEQAAKYLKKGD